MPTVAQKDDVIQSRHLLNEFSSQNDLPTKIDVKKCLAKIIGTGSFLPGNEYSISDLKKYFAQIDEEWVLNNIGVKTRYFVRNFDSGIISHTPVSLDMAVNDKRIKKDDLVLLVAAGAGWMYGACLIKW